MLDLRQLAGDFKVYGEVRLQENRDLRVQLVNGQLTTNFQETSRGISARAFHQGAWGFSSHSMSNLDSARTALKEATRNAQFIGERKKNSVRLTTGTAASFEHSFATRRERATVSTWIDLLRGLDEIITRRWPDLQARSLAIMTLDMEKHLLTSEGVQAQTLIPRSHLVVSMTKNTASGPVTFRDVQGGLGHAEERFLHEPNHFTPWLESIYQRTSDKAQGVIPEGGLHDVILNCDLAGILAHEAVGHTAEADLVLGGSVAGQNLGKIVASPLVTLVDFAHTAFGETCPQPIFVDDEGTRATDTVIIEKGVLKTFMNNKETAAHFDQPATGHARAFKFSDEPLIRMRNTAILPGTSKREDLIASIDNGYLLMNPGNGQADTTGEFMFAVGLGYEIKNGKLGRPLRDATISGVAFDMLKTVTMVSDEFDWESAGYCGKKQPMPVGMGGPSIKCQVHVGGR